MSSTCQCSFGGLSELYCKDEEQSTYDFVNLYTMHWLYVKLVVVQVSATNSLDIAMIKSPQKMLVLENLLKSCGNFFAVINLSFLSVDT